MYVKVTTSHGITFDRPVDFNSSRLPKKNKGGHVPSPRFCENGMKKMSWFLASPHPSFWIHYHFTELSCFLLLFYRSHYKLVCEQAVWPVDYSWTSLLIRRDGLPRRIVNSGGNETVSRWCISCLMIWTNRLCKGNDHELWSGVNIS